MRTLGLASLAASAALVLAAVPATAAPAVAPAAPEIPAGIESPAAIESPTGIDDGVPAVPTTLADALQGDLGLTLEQFLAQAKTGNQLATAQSTWARMFTNTFGGAWLDEAGTGHVAVAPGEGDEQLREAVTAAGFTVADVDLSRVALEQRLNEALELLGDLPTEQLALVTGAHIDTPGNDVVVQTTGGTDEQVADITRVLEDVAEVDTLPAPAPANDAPAFGSEGTGDGLLMPNGNGSQTQEQRQPAREGGADGEAGTGGETGTGFGGSLGDLGSLALLADLDVFEGTGLDILLSLLGGAGNATGSIIEGMTDPAPNPARTGEGRTRTHIPVPSGPIAGGTAFDSPAARGMLECSTGFNGTLDGKPVVITAAHCAGSDGAKASFPDGTEFGTFAAVQRDRIDSALISVDDSFAERFSNNLVGTGEGDTQEITGTSAPVVGQKVCKSGSRTGYSCGSVTEIGATIDVSGVRTIEGGFLIDVCALPGDSGGVVFSGDRAVGIASASNVADSADCAQAATAAQEGGFSPSLSAVPIDAVLAGHPGLELRTS